jgi:AraC-like DNA-binding protein
MDRLLLAAKREALFTARSSKEVAFGLGFDDPAHFSKFFKTATDITFMTYRQQLRAGNI